MHADPTEAARNPTHCCTAPGSTGRTPHTHSPPVHVFSELQPPRGEVQAVLGMEETESSASDAVPAWRVFRSHGPGVSDLGETEQAEGLS